MTPKSDDPGRDIRAALKTAEAALEAAIERERDRVEIFRHRVAEVVHDIKNPLTALLAYSNLLRREALGPLGDPRYKKHAETIHTAGQRLLDYCQALLDDYLRDIRQQQGEAAPLVREDVDVAAMVREVVALYQELAEERGIRLEAKISDDFPALHTLSTNLHRALTNLVSNALKFTPRGGKVTVDAHVDENKEAVVVVVRDSGIGLSAGEILRILSQDAGTQSGHGEKGAGLGLINVTRLIRQAGGSVEITSTKGRGTAVTLRFPRDLSRPAAPSSG
ncbi:MAG: HAMP domain-containing histidine kinase [Rhodospirillales bacterium]|nr:HAMP domain-containing histidine kinase [Rhodospirillales bacterium]